MAVSEILIFVPWVGFRRIVRSVIGHRIGGNDSCSLIEIERDVAFQTDRKTQIRSGRKMHGSAAGSCSSVDGLVNRGSIDGLAVAFRTKSSHIVHTALRVLPSDYEDRERDSAQDCNGPSHACCVSYCDVRLISHYETVFHIEYFFD